MGDAAATVVPHYEELLETELRHHPNLIGGHPTLGIGLVRRIGGRFAAVAVAAQIGRHDGERISQQGSNTVPAAVSLRIAVQQQERGTFAADYKMNVGAVAGQRL